MLAAILQHEPCPRLPLPPGNIAEQRGLAGQHRRFTGQHRRFTGQRRRDGSYRNPDSGLLGCR